MGLVTGRRLGAADTQQRQVAGALEGRKPSRSLRGSIPEHRAWLIQSGHLHFSDGSWSHAHLRVRLCCYRSQAVVTQFKMMPVGLGRCAKQGPICL